MDCFNFLIFIILRGFILGAYNFLGATDPKHFQTIQILGPVRPVFYEQLKANELTHLRSCRFVDECRSHNNLISPINATRKNKADLELALTGPIR